MIIKKLTYFGLALCATALAGCSDDVTIPDTLSGDGTKTPLGVTALLDAGGASTRAANKEFASGDELLSYIRHVTATKTTTDGKTTYSNIVEVNATGTPKLVTFLAGSMSDYTGGDIAPIGLVNKTDEKDRTLGLTSTNTKQTTDLKAKDGENKVPIYWDDFSESSNGGDKDLRTQGHYLQSYYGYCYNGGTPNIALTDATGELGWKVATDQSVVPTDASVPSNFQKSDLLWSAEQDPVGYAHATYDGGIAHGQLILPYTHAMSKVTINLEVKEGFADDFAFDGTNIQLHEMYTTCTCTAPNYTLTDKGTTAGVKKVTDITMKKGSPASKKCTYEAIVVPSILSVGNNLATITGLNNDTYNIPVTAEILQETTADHNGWGGELTETDENISTGSAQAPPRTRAIVQGKGYEMKSGVNYVLNVEISKQGISVVALIKDWVSVEAEGRAEISFNADIISHNKTNGINTNGASFALWRSTTEPTTGEKTATVTFNNKGNDDPNDDVWVCDPAQYWLNSTQAYYFRALAKYNESTSTKYSAFTGENASHAATTDLKLYQGSDIVWATTPAHTGYYVDAQGQTQSKEYAAGVAIEPRTGSVPMEFEHAMSKITVELKTAEGDATSVTSPNVDLTGAKIEISNLATNGTIILSDGEITPDATVTENAIPQTNSIVNLPVIPQDIDDNAILKITLTDGTAYKLQLNKCVVNDNDDDDDNDVLIDKWERGKHYSYTIQVDKEAIIFRGMVKDWDPVKGSGSANLDWD